MLYSQIFGKTNKTAKEFDSINATLLIKAGFIDQTMSGVYTYLPLGYRVLNKIEDIIRQEMDKIGTELFMPAFSPKELWKATQRFEGMDVLFKAEGANETSKLINDTTYVLNPTHEEVITPIAKKFNLSYKDLPFGVYQIQTKFRNEPRPKSGLLRSREFRMKDLYSFHKTEEGLKEFYKKAKDAYFEVYKRVGIAKDTFYAAASGGDFTDEFSHEFQTKCETGEDTIFYCKTDNIAYNKEIAPSLAPEAQMDEEPKDMQETLTKGMVSVEQLVEFLGVFAHQTAKTIIYESDKGILVACVRGDYEINEEKLKKSAEAKWIKMAEDNVVEEFTGAKTGYAGIVNLPEDKKHTLLVDESVKYLKNFVTGANKTDYHFTNVDWDKDVHMPEVFHDIKVAKEGDLHPDCGEKYEVFKASEVGNIFPLNVKFSKAFDYFYTDEMGEKKLVYMGSYGLGSSRLMGILVEKFHDQNGIIWPESVAPFKVHLVGLNLDNKEVLQKAQNVYDQLLEDGIEVLFDDRVGVSAGEKLSDADLVGVPYRVVVSEKTGDEYEVKKRTEEKSALVDYNTLQKNLQSS